MLVGSTCLLYKLKQIIFYSTIVIFISIDVLVFCCVGKMLCKEINIGSCAEVVTAIIATLSAFVAYNEYLSHNDSKQAQVLSEYNKRYSEDNNIIKVVKYLNYIDEGGIINNPCREKPSNYEVEMFMRFYEELELQIKYKRIDLNDVCNLFCYYANMIYTNPELRHYLGIDDNDYDNNWSGFKKLMSKYNDHDKNTEL